MKYKTPNFFIIGTPKAGTTALQTMLSNHPDVFMSPLKEPHYFSTDFKVEEFAPDYRRNHLCDLTDYLKAPLLKKIHLAHTPTWEQYSELYRDAGGHKAIGEASSGYLYSTEAAKNIYNKIPSARIIMILRDPVDRAYSHFSMDKASGRVQTSSFVAAVERDFQIPSKAWGGKHLYVELGLYYEQVRRYLEVFPSSQIKIIFYDDWVQDNKKVLDEVCKFLEIRTDDWQVAGTIYHKSKKPRFHHLHHLITLTRFRELQRKFLPETIRKQLINVWYSSSPRNELAAADRQKLSKLFDNNKQKLRVLLGKPGLWV
ncbi:MAG: sulfotransferase [Pseudomonadota bacterium]